MTRCYWCGRRLHYKRGRGWCHPEGGLIQQYCPACGWTSAPEPALLRCPRCGGYLRDDHCALPAMGEMEDTPGLSRVLERERTR